MGALYVLGAKKASGVETLWSFAITSSPLGLPSHGGINFSSKVFQRKKPPTLVDGLVSLSLPLLDFPQMAG